jgi:pyruvate kinase
MTNRHTQLIVTLGPATRTEQDLRIIKGKGANFVRVNMSHSSIEDLGYFVDLSKRVGIPFMLDTEGSQIRTGRLADGSHDFQENERVIVRAGDACDDPHEICLKPGHVVEQLEVGDLIHVDFDTLILRIIDADTRSQGYVTARRSPAGASAVTRPSSSTRCSTRNSIFPPCRPKTMRRLRWVSRRASGTSPSRSSAPAPRSRKSGASQTTR